MFKGDEITKKRKAEGMNAKQLAEYLNVSVDNLYKWEKGHAPSKPEDYLKIIAWMGEKVENVPLGTSANEDQGAYGADSDRNLSNLTESTLILAESNKGLVDGQLRLIAIIESLNLGELVKARQPTSDLKKGNSPGMAVVPLADKKIPRGSAKKKDRQKDKVS